MRITFKMSVRDELPDLLNELAQEHGAREEYTVSRPIDIMRQVEWPTPPRRGEYVWIADDAAPRTVQEVHWDLETGEIRVSLDELDTDEMGEEGRVVEFLLDRGWQIDIEMMGWETSR
jgi:hypothetical protein